MFPRPKEVKHVACARCRERKVKCDGGKPTCRRCQRLGHECQYVQGKKQQEKSEWVQHLTTFNSQPGRLPSHSSTTFRPLMFTLTHMLTLSFVPGKAGKLLSSQPWSQAQSSQQPPHLLHPNSKVETSSTNYTIFNSRSTSPHPRYTTRSSSPPTNDNHVRLDAEASFHGSDNLDTWMPSVSSSAHVYMNDETLDAPMFMFSPSQMWADANYTSELLTTNAEDALMGDGKGTGMTGEQGYGCFDA